MTNFSSPWARARGGPEFVDLAVGRLALPSAGENPDEVVAAPDAETEAVIRELEATRKEVRYPLRTRTRVTAAEANSRTILRG